MGWGGVVRVPKKRGHTHTLVRLSVCLLDLPLDSHSSPRRSSSQIPSLPPSPLSHESNQPLNPLLLASTTNSQRSLCDHRRPSLLGRTDHRYSLTSSNTRVCLPLIFIPPSPYYNMLYMINFFFLLFDPPFSSSSPD